LLSSFNTTSTSSSSVLFSTTAPSTKVQSDKLISVSEEAVERKEKLELAMEKKRKRVEDALTSTFTGAAVIDSAVMQSLGHVEHVLKEASPVETGAKSKTLSKAPKKTAV